VPVTREVVVEVVDVASLEGGAVVGTVSEAPTPGAVDSVGVGAVEVGAAPSATVVVVSPSGAGAEAGAEVVVEAEVARSSSSPTPVTSAATPPPMSSRMSRASSRAARERVRGVCMTR